MCFRPIEYRKRRLFRFPFVTLGKLSRSGLVMAPTLKNSRKSLSTKHQTSAAAAADKENSFLHSVSEFHSRIRRRESIRLKYKVNENLREYIVIIIRFRNIVKIVLFSWRIADAIRSADLKTIIGERWKRKRSRPLFDRNEFLTEKAHAHTTFIYWKEAFRYENRSINSRVRNFKMRTRRIYYSRFFSTFRRRFLKLKF